MKTSVNVNTHNRWFSTNHLKDNLKSKAVKGGFNTIGGQAISFGLTVLSTALMVRLLTPEDYGLVMMVTAITGFITIFQNLGLSSAIIQKESISQDQVNAIFWVNVLISLGIALIVASLAPLLVYLYKENRLLNITLVFSLSIFFAGFAPQHYALLKRQMNFKALSLIQIGSAVISVVIGISLAYAGFGYWAIVASMISKSVISTIGVWLACDWKPNFSFNSSKINSFLRFGSGIAAFDLINYFSRNLDNVLIGKYRGSVALGLYSKAYQLLMLPITLLRDPLNSVALPALSSLQNDKDKFRSFYKRFIFTLSFFSMPFVIYLAVFSEELIILLLGEKWLSASYVFKLLAISSFIQPVETTRGLIMTATGKTKRHFFWGVINAVFVITGFLIGIQWGMEGIAISYAIVNYLILLPSLQYGFKGTPITVSLFFNEIFFSMTFSLLAGVAMFLFKYYFVSLPPLALFSLGFLVGFSVYLALWQFNEVTRNKLQHISELRYMIFKKKSNNS